MRKWILFALVGLVLLYTFSVREGVDDTLTKEPQCPPGMTLQGELCRKDYGQPTVCPSGQPSENGFCMQPDGNGGTSGVGALCEEGLPVNGRCISTRTPNCPSGYVFETNGPFGTYKCVTNAAAATNVRRRAEESVAASQPVPPRGSASSSSTYTPTPVTYSGLLPPPITESPDTDSGAARSTTGDVFSSGGPFSGQPGNGGMSAASALASMSGNTYGSSGPNVSLSPFDFFPKSSMSAPSPAPPGSSLRVKGPSWGGKGQSASSASASSGIPNPFLYGPGSGNKSSSGSDGSGFGFQLNSGDTSMLPSLDSLGSNPENQYAPTSRVPGDQDLVPNPYLQSTSYSLANNSQKTDPVPFLANFSAFQK